eukprot:212111-Amphidinium_carterae.1
MNKTNKNYKEKVEELKRTDQNTKNNILQCNHLFGLYLRTRELLNLVHGWDSLQSAVGAHAFPSKAGTATTRRQCPSGHLPPRRCAPCACQFRSAHRANQTTEQGLLLFHSYLTIFCTT